MDKSRIVDISTNKRALKNGSRKDWEEQLLRYQKAIRKFLQKLIGGPGAEQVAAQVFELFLRGHYQKKWKPAKGRFRDYLKVSLRNAAYNYRDRNPSRKEITGLVDQLEDRSGEVWAHLDNELRQKVLEHAFKALKKQKKTGPKDSWPTLISLMKVNAEKQEPAPQLKFLREQLGIDAKDEKRNQSLRKQVERARDQLAKLIWNAGQELVSSDSPERVAEELRALGLWSYIVERVEEL